MLLSYFVDKFFKNLFAVDSRVKFGLFFFCFFFFFFILVRLCDLLPSIVWFFDCFSSLGLGQCSHIPKWDLNYDFALLFWFLSDL